MDILRTEIIRRFLEANTHHDLATLYNPAMECQVNVAADGGNRIESEYLGRPWHGWTDGISVWKSFRIPRSANTNPEYTDTPINWDFDAHVEGIGMTGWDWQSKLSRWVGFDFDAIIGHKSAHTKKLTAQEIEEAKRIASEIPWVTVRKSTSGKGLHLYVFLDPVSSNNHTEHAALARSILGVMAAQTGYDFTSRVDACGSNLWVWHRKLLGTDGLELVKEADEDYYPPDNWREHIPVIKGTRRKATPSFVIDSESDELTRAFDDLISQTTRTPLDQDHRRLIEWLSEKATWNQDHHLLITHTYTLKEAHEILNLRGIYETLATGKERPDLNCFLHPLPNGAWSLRRYTRGVAEAKTWDQDGAGWTRCYYNREPTLDAAAKASDGIESDKGGFMFKNAESAVESALALGASIKIPARLMFRKASIKMHKDGRRIVVSIEKQDDDSSEEMEDWLAEKKIWKKIFTTRLQPETQHETKNYDEVVRHLTTADGADYGWVLRNSSGAWNREPLQHIASALESLGLSPKDAKYIVGSSVVNCWTIVNQPFAEEYPGDRVWNLNAPQLSAIPSLDLDNLRYPAWSKLLNHCGTGLDDAIKTLPWALAAGIHTGADYLKCWIASVLQEPFEPLPYLFFYGPENCGKSSFVEAIELLMTRGVMNAGQAIKNPQGFNAEIINSVVCSIEETDLNKNQIAYARIKEWVTARNVLLHEKRRTPFLIKNTTHWVQTANNIEACPIFPGDTRITLIKVMPLVEEIPKTIFFQLLTKEISDFLAALLSLEIPDSGNRLNIPVVMTEAKRSAQQANYTQLEMFVMDHCFYSPGEWLKFSDFYDRFLEWLEPISHGEWTKHKVSAKFPNGPYVGFLNGRRKQDNQRYVGNISFTKPDNLDDLPYILVNGFLEKQIEPKPFETTVKTS